MKGQLCVDVDFGLDLGRENHVDEQEGQNCPREMEEQWRGAVGKENRCRFI
jgi:hypothetical protein